MDSCTSSYNMQYIYIYMDAGAQLPAHPTPTASTDEQPHTPKGPTSPAHTMQSLCTDQQPPPPCSVEACCFGIARMHALLRRSRVYLYMLHDTVYGHGRRAGRETSSCEHTMRMPSQAAFWPARGNGSEARTWTVCDESTERKYVVCRTRARKRSGLARTLARPNTEKKK